MYRTGFVVGKFCPLTLGHQYLLDTASELCDNLIVLSYTSEKFLKCESTEREYWLKTLYPRARVFVLHEDDQFPKDDDPAEAHRAFCLNFLLNLETSVQAVFTSEEYGNGLTEYIAEGFKTYFGRPIQVDHVLVDLKRNKVPVSGTEVRKLIQSTDQESRARLQTSVSRTVLASLIPRIVFLGGESTGKSTISSLVARELKCPNVLEYGRIYCQNIGGTQNLAFEDMQVIAEQQVQLERFRARPLNAGQILVCDTSPLTTLFYSIKLFNTASSKLWDLAERQYDRVYLCEPDFEFVQDGTRIDNEFRKLGNHWYEQWLTENNIPFVRLSGRPEYRLQAVLHDLRTTGLLNVG